MNHNQLRALSPLCFTGRPRVRGEEAALQGERCEDHLAFPPRVDKPVESGAGGEPSPRGERIAASLQAT